MFIRTMHILNQILLGLDAEGNHLPVSIQYLASTARTLDTVMSHVSNVPHASAELVSIAIAEPILATRRAQEQQNRSIMDAVNEVRNIVVACLPSNPPITPLCGSPPLALLGLFHSQGLCTHLHHSWYPLGRSPTPLTRLLSPRRGSVRQLTALGPRPPHLTLALRRRHSHRL